MDIRRRIIRKAVLWGRDPRWIMISALQAWVYATNDRRYRKELESTFTHSELVSLKHEFYEAYEAGRRQ